jgi:Arc/MetJ family transcription regulator
MRTNIDIDEKLLVNVMKYEGQKTKKELVKIAFEELINLRRRQKLKSLFGKVKWEGNLLEMRGK